MKKIKYIFPVLCIASLCSCGTTDVWKDWENQGNMDETSRLRPSEVKKILCSKDGWKMNYEGVDFYLQFDENGGVITNTNEKILRPEIATGYHLDFEGEKVVLLTITGNSSLQYLKSNQESTFRITDYSENSITAKGSDFGISMNLSPVSASDIETVKSTKEAILKKVEAIDGFNCGGIRLADGGIVAYYTLSADNDNKWSVELVTVSDRNVNRTEYPLTLNIEGEKGVLEADGIEIAGYPLVNITYDYGNSSAPVIGNEDLVFDSAAASDWADMYLSSWNTHLIDAQGSSAGVSSVPSTQLEMDDRNPRNMVICPNDDNEWWYVFYEISTYVDGKTNTVHFSNTSVYLPFGGDNSGIAKTQEQFKPLLDVFFGDEGLWVWDDDDAYYLIQPVSHEWIRVGK